MNALFQLIKARKPDAFVWLGVVKEDNRSDEPWLKAMTFQPDGLQISNLRQFHSPFAETRARYVEIVGTNTPLMVAGFYGYTAALQDKGEKLFAALKNKDKKAGQAAKADVTVKLGGIGAVVGQNLAKEEADLQSLGYRGLSAHWLLLTAVANSGKAAGVDKSDLLDPRAGLLEAYYSAKDYASFAALASELISNSTPGDMNWAVGKVCQGMVLLSQTPPRTSEAIPVLDEVLAFDFKDRPGRDYCIVCAVQWRIYAAHLSGDGNKAQELVQWVQKRELRKDLKSTFLKRYGGIQAQTTTPSQ